MGLECLLVLDSLQVLLVLNFLFNVLVPLKKFIVLVFSQLQPLIKVSLQFLLERIHFILLLLNKLGLGSNDLLVSLLHVLLPLFKLKLLTHHLDLMGLGILLLLSEALLDLLLIQ